jgi:hypothetical protein
MSGPVPAEFATVFDRLRAIMLSVGRDQLVSRDDPGDLVVRHSTIDPKTGQPGWVGTVTIKKRYVAYHLMRLYEDPGPADHLSPALAKRRQGKTCFNFTKVDDALFEELVALTRLLNGG